MKKSVVLLLIAAICLWSIFAAAEEANHIVSGETKETACLIPEWEYATKLVSKGRSSDGFTHYNWYVIEAAEEGDNSIAINATEIDTSVCFQNMRGENLDGYRLEGNIVGPKSYIYKDTSHVLTVHLTVGEKLYIEVNCRRSFTMSVCYNEKHQIGIYSEIGQEPTCASPGTRVYPCELCRQPGKTEEIPALGHTPGEWLTETVATCVTPGKLVQRCTVCNEVIAAQEIPAMGHVAGEKTVALEPTCLQTGLQTVQCTVCSEVIESEVIPISAHQLGLMTSVKAATCTQSGRNEQHCIVCNATLASEEVPALGHTPGMWSDQPPVTCIADGIRVQYCDACNAELNVQNVSAYGHSMTEWEETREATCLQSGQRARSCSTCGTVLEREEIPALGHSYTEWKTTIEATKEREGEKRRHCIHCGDTQFEMIARQEKFLGIF